MTHRRLAYFLPDAFDLVDPTFDFDKETRSKTGNANRHRNYQYAHELFPERVYDGMLISKGIVDPIDGTTGHYSPAQRERIERDGGRAFLRLTDRQIPIMGDCGAFSYVSQTKPPVTVDEVLQFYEEWDANYGLSVDHVIRTYTATHDHGSAKELDPEVRERQDITLQLATEFFETHRTQKCQLIPMGVAQGWSPLSYASAVAKLQQIGYTYIALGGLVTLKTNDILTVLHAIANVRAPKSQLHLLGVTRTDAMPLFSDLGVVSIDSTAPLRRAFKDQKENYYTANPKLSYTAIRIPQVGGNPDLRKRIASGEIQNDDARRLEQECLDALKAYDHDKRTLQDTVKTLRAYEKIHHPKTDMSEVYTDVLGNRPWRKCPCQVCKELGYHVILFRGAERNRRRGFHNIWTFYNKHLKRPPDEESDAAEILVTS